MKCQEANIAVWLQFFLACFSVFPLLFNFFFLAICNANFFRLSHSENCAAAVFPRDCRFYRQFIVGGGVYVIFWHFFLSHIAWELNALHGQCI